MEEEPPIQPESDPTDHELQAVQREPPAKLELGEALHLVILWFVDAPERIGQCAPLLHDAWLGRQHHQHPDRELLNFGWMRPGEIRPAPRFTETKLSRRQLEFRPLTPNTVVVRNHGHKALSVNGQKITEAIVSAGDTLSIEGVALLLVERRPREIPPSEHYRSEAFEFGDRDYGNMVGESPPTWELRERLGMAARADGHVLLFGETGAGKDVAARVLHELSPRIGPLVVRNAATVPEGLVDAELFGSAKNYPNAGMEERLGLVTRADGGHLFLDEIGNMGHAEQSHLLGVIDHGGLYHVLGESRDRYSDFRLIAATNLALSSLKHDLAARCTRRIVVTGLNDRKSDLPFLIQRYLARVAHETPEVVSRWCGADERLRHEAIDPQLIDVLVRHQYTQHTRELHRFLDAAIDSSPAEWLTLTPMVEAAMREPLGASTQASGSSQPAPLPGREACLVALNQEGWNVSAAARILRLSRHQLHSLIRSLDLK